MNSIAKALNNIALAITNLSKSLSPTKDQVTTLPLSKSVTSNPGNPNVKITSVYQGKSFYEDKKENAWNSPKIAHIPEEEKLALDAIYNALIDKGNHPDHHDHIMRELSIKWPVLHKALKHFISVRNNTYNKPSSEIWKTKNKW
jgi:hypothetical protein